MAATHNERSVLRIVRLLESSGAAARSGRGIFFGQLLGMCDHVSFALGAAGFRVFKYVPYGPVMEVVPYLLRRAHENSDVLLGVGKEMRLLRAELARRARARIGI